MLFTAPDAHFDKKCLLNESDAEIFENPNQIFKVE